MYRVEDLYDTPPVLAELHGGYFDGQRVYMAEDRDTWIMPVPIEPSALLRPVPPSEISTALFNVTIYRYTGHIQDDGTRVFQWTP